MTSPQVNGDVPHSTGDSSSSAFLQHLLGYPVINDGITTFKSNPYGQRSIALSDSAYKTFAAPVLPYFAKPYQFVSPYIKKADDLGEKTLSKVDKRFPAVRKPTDELYQDARDLALLPYRVGLAGRDHVLSTYSSAKSKAGGDNLVSYGKALINTAVIVTTEAFATVGSVISPKNSERSSQTVNGDEKGIN
ncbi:hypothetical protein QBC33DRAFT_5306 [Phialemonium atrogriseum]|uniref:Perilipin MPL1-like protein n=1 Tax=Phialemonium atrogriseum TaxID=1093897 RepID=A0AAJ0FLK9_9PEZI|nr:uncharacterized protein QBC33DRAFT_5306 [Phialemonium atrogriseum]KAK1772317.1 hypothetical protein QBC33DRAFT_5306 [Phialemonium atrogriseum]